MSTVLLKLRHWGGAASMLTLCLVLLLPGCQQKCQPPATQKFRTLAETQWRLVETSDKAVQGLDRFNFLIYNFSRNFSGSINQVRYNDQAETPYKTFNWNINPNSGELVIRYQGVSPPAESGGGAATQRQGPTDVLYSYDLGGELSLTDQRGNYYRMVPFTGVVDPDSNCVF